MQVQAPYQGTAGSPTYRTTSYRYDQMGNPTQVITPRANAAGFTTAFVARTTYDVLNRPSRQYQPYDPADSRYNDADVYTETDYDAAWRVAKTSTDPWSITTSYDYNELGKQTARTLTSAGGSSSRTMNWSFYPDGSLASRTDDGVPVGLQVALVDNSDAQNTSTTDTWATATTGDPTTEQGYDYRTHAAGAGTDAFTWQVDVPQDGTYTVYAKYPQVSGVSATAGYTVTHNGTATAKTVNQTTGANTWVSLGAYTFSQSRNSSVSLAQSSTGTVVADAVKLVPHLATFALSEGAVEMEALSSLRECPSGVPDSCP